MKKAGSSKKSSRHHILLVSVFAIIIFLAVIAFVLQRNTYLEAVAGEAIQQTKQLALTEEEAAVSAAIQKGEGNVFIRCPSTINPKVEQWDIPQGWKEELLKPVEAQCFDYKISCYYADSPAAANRVDQVVVYNALSGVKNCREAKSVENLGCDCEIAADSPSPQTSSG